MRLLRGVRDRYEARAMGHPTPWLLLRSCTIPTVLDYCTILNPKNVCIHCIENEDVSTSNLIPAAIRNKNGAHRNLTRDTAACSEQILQYKHKHRSWTTIIIR